MKTYEKPLICIENFVVAEHIAGGCGSIINWRNESCFENFFNIMEHCSDFDTNQDGKVDENDGPYDDYCYWASARGLFTSV